MRKKFTLLFASLLVCVGAMAQKAHQRVSHEGWVVTALNEAGVYGNEGGVAFIADDNPATFYHSNWGSFYDDGTANVKKGADGLQAFMVELPHPLSDLSLITYKGRSDNNGSGWARGVRVYVFETLPEGWPADGLSSLGYVDKEALLAKTNANLGTAAFDNTSVSVDNEGNPIPGWSNDRSQKLVEFETLQSGKYVLFVMESGSDIWLTCSDFQIYQYKDYAGIVKGTPYFLQVTNAAAKGMKFVDTYTACADNSRTTIGISDEPRKTYFDWADDAWLISTKEGEEDKFLKTDVWCATPQAAEGSKWELFVNDDQSLSILQRMYDGGDDNSRCFLGGNVVTSANDTTLFTDNEKGKAINIKIVDGNAIPVTVKYVFTYSGETKGEQETGTFIGEEYPEATIALPYGVSAAKPTGKIDANDAVEGVITKTIELHHTLPFVPAASYADITNWYYLQFHSTVKNYLYYDGTTNVLDASKTSVDASSKDAYSWAFVGNPFDGFKVVNRLAGEDKALKAVADGAVVDAGGQVMTFTASSYVGEGEVGFFMQSSTGDNTQRFNKQNSKVVYWSGADAGSTFMVIERDITGATELQALIDAVEMIEYTEGTTVGYIKSLDALNTAIDNAKAAVESKTDCDMAAVALQEAEAALETVQPDTTKFYTIVNAMPSTDKRGGQMMYINADSCMQFRPEYSDSALFQFKDAGEGKFYLYNVVNKTYLSTAKAHGSNSQAELKADSVKNAKPVVITNMGRSNVVKIVPEGGAMLHAQADGSKVVGWNNDDNMNASAWIIVENIEVEKVALDTKAIEFLTLDSIVQLTATVSPDEATYKNVTWATDNDKVATVDAEGRVTSVGNGEAIITATAPNGKADTCKVTVDATIVEVVWVELNMESITFVTADSTVQLIATIVPDDATYKNIKWSSSAETVATVDDNGLVTPVGNGTSIITATAANGKSEECLVTVNIPIEVAEVKLDKAEATLTTAGATVQLKATVAPEDAWEKTITWTSDNDKVATVDQTGKVTAVADGIATITATAANGVKATCKVTVAILVEVAEITLDKESIEFVSADSTVQIVAIIAPDNATDKTITWSSSDEKVATVDQTGQVTSVANGTATITATTANGKTATCTVTVNIPEENGIDNITADKELIIYDLHGRRVTTMEKGIYIVNGKKVVVK